jgi:hypothetical protein
VVNYSATGANVLRDGFVGGEPAEDSGTQHRILYTFQMLSSGASSGSDIRNKGIHFSNHCWRQSLSHVKTAQKKVFLNVLHRLFQKKPSGTAMELVHSRLFPKETAIASSSEHY